MTTTKQFLIPIPFLDTEIRVIVTPDIQKERNKLKKFNIPENEISNINVVDGLHVSYYNIYSAHWIFLKPTMLLDSIVHESVHCVNAMCSWFGIADDEFSAYMTSWIVSNIIELKEKHYKKIK